MNRNSITIRIISILIALNIFGMALLYVNNQRIQDNIVYEFNQVAAQEGVTLPQGQLAQAQTEAALQTFLITLLVIVVICCVTGLALHRSLRKLKFLQENMHQIGAGKLAEEVDTKLAGEDEIGRLISTTAVLNERLRQVVYPLFFSSSRLTGNAGFLKDVSVSGMKKMEGVTAELSQVGTDLSLAGKHLTNADKAVEEISAASSLISEQVHNLQHTYLDLADAVKSGRNEMKRFEEIGQVLSEKGKATVHKAQELETMSNDIGNITATIMNVSTQTNLLALNAAIESARAGEQGRGFAIVAEEVRKLAAETSDYASQISALIAGVQSNIHLFAEEIDSMGVAIEEESQSTQVVTATMDKIITQIEHVQEVVLDISGITQEQNASSQAVSAAVTTVNENMNHLIKAMVQVIEAVNRQMTENFSSIIKISEEGNVIVEDLREIISSYTLPDEIILRQVINDHMVFVLKYEFIVNKDLYFNEAEIPDHYACRLGRWIATVKDEKILKLFNEMIDHPHHQVHALAKEAVILNNAGRQAEAQTKVAEMIAASQEIVKALENFIANLEKFPG